LRNRESKAPNEQIFKEVKQRIFESKPADWEFEEFRTRLWEIELLWEGLARVKISIDPRAEEVLQSDSALASHTVELCSSLCSAAIRKFAADEVSFLIQLVAGGQLEVISVDNCKGLDGDKFSAIPDVMMACSFEYGQSRDGVEHRQYFLLPGARSL